MGVGAMSDTYNPFERTLRVTRGALELIKEFGFGVSVDTKSALITRHRRAERHRSGGRKSRRSPSPRPTTSWRASSNRTRPRLASASPRWPSWRTPGCSAASLFTPTLPFVTDDDATVRGVVEGAAAAGARFVYHMTGVTMRDRQRDHFLDRIAAVDPTLPERYRAAFGDRYFCNSPRATENRALFRSLCKQHGLLWRMSDIIAAYKPSQPMGAQTSLF
ncbi:MAG: radical SAM protein [Eggerthella lenta]